MSKNSKHILIVDDHAEIREALGELLEISGYSVSTAGNGEEALLRLQVKQPQLILLDLMMPVMNGWDFLRSLRGEKRWRELPVIIISAYEDRAPPSEQVQGVMRKPVDFSALVAMIERVCGAG